MQIVLQRLLSLISDSFSFAILLSNIVICNINCSVGIYEGLAITEQYGDWCTGPGWVGCYVCTEMWPLAWCGICPINIACLAVPNTDDVLYVTII